MWRAVGRRPLAQNRKILFSPRSRWDGCRCLAARTRVRGTQSRRNGSLSLLGGSRRNGLVEQVGRANRDTDLTVLSSSTSGRRTRTARGRAAPSTGRRQSERATAARERHASEASTSGTAVGSVDGGPSRSTNRSENQFAVRAGPVCPAARAAAATTPNGSGVRRRQRLTKSYLVDPASSYMLVSKIKPCMSKYIPRHGETANGSLNRSLFIGSFILLG